MPKFLGKFDCALWAALISALLLRLATVGYGLPSLLDPDEPLFMLKGYELLDHATLNPHWFGHPGTLTIYTVAIVEAAVAGMGLLVGRFQDLDTFAKAVLADPSTLLLPARLVFALCSVVAVYLTAKVSRQIMSPWASALAAALVAFNGLHILWSQVIRTDIQSSVFILAAIFFALRASTSGKTRDFVMVGIMTGLAMATKWPGGVAAAAGIGAAFYRARHANEHRLLLRRWLTIGSCSLASLFLASPYLLLDWRKALADISGEVASGHLGHDGRGPIGNVGYYGELAYQTMGLPALLAIAVGLVVIARQPRTRLIVLPVLAIQIALISAQVQIWSRWLTPSIPLLAICAAAGIDHLLGATRSAKSLKLSRSFTAIFLLAWPAVTAARDLDARRNDTRSQASQWARQHLPDHASVLVEHLALEFQASDWHILFPMGKSGCQEGRSLLSPSTNYAKVQKERSGSIVNIGNLPHEVLKDCKADYLILSYYDGYASAKGAYAKEWQNYKTISSGYETIAQFSPRRVESGGPVVRIFRRKDLPKNLVGQTFSW